MRPFAVALAIILAIVCVASRSDALPLDLELEASPDISSMFINVDYDPGSDVFSADGFALVLKLSSSFEQISNGAFELEATIDASGNASAGTIVISGTIASLGFNSGTLLSGALTAFGFREEGGDPLEFLFEVTGGDAASLYGRIAGVILADASFAGDFVQRTASQFAVADTAAILMPEPAAGVLLLGGAASLLFRSRRRRRTAA